MPTDTMTEDNMLSMLAQYAQNHPGESPSNSPMYKLFMMLCNFKDEDILQDALDTIRGYREHHEK